MRRSHWEKYIPFCTCALSKIYSILHMCIGKNISHFAHAHWVKYIPFCTCDNRIGHYNNVTFSAWEGRIGCSISYLVYTFTVSHSKALIYLASRKYIVYCGRGGSVVGSVPCVRMVAGSNPTL